MVKQPEVKAWQVLLSRLPLLAYDWSVAVLGWDLAESALNTSNQRKDAKMLTSYISLISMRIKENFSSCVSVK